MAHRAYPTTFEERVAILERATAGQSDAEIAAALHCSFWTVRKWRRIGQRHGRAGLAPPIGRPPTGPLGSIAPALREAILKMRRTHPGWGADTILAELRTDPLWAAYRLPSRARIAALFKHAKLTRRYNRHTELPEPMAAPEGRPHDVWELDAQGPVIVEHLGRVCLVNVIDTTSRLKVESYPCVDTTNPPLETYQLVLRRAFLATGVPRQITFDRGTVFFDNTTTSPFPTRLHLWLLALGVEVSFTRVRRPTDHAHVERVHQTMTLQTLLGQSWSDAPALWAGLDARRTMLNAHIPCRMLGGRAPLQAYPEAGHTGRFYRPEWETELLDLNRVYAYLGTCRWFRRVAQNGSVAIGGIYYYINPKYRGRAIEVTFDSDRALFRAQVAGLAEAIEIIPRGLTKESLMGEAGTIAALPAYQLVLPFTHEAQRVMDYIPLVRRMTLCDFAS
jgi:transposase InsO family protein